MNTRQHWENVYATKPIDRVSWFQPHAGRSLQRIRDTGVAKSAPIVDIGGGASVLVDDLLADGYSNVSVLDISANALAHARRRLGGRAAEVRWIESDVLEAALPERSFEIWHDRAAFHFLTSAQDRSTYRRAASHALRPGGYLLLATFASDGPERCSGLPVVRYDGPALHAELGEDFELVHHETESHRTPSGTEQRFLLATFRKIPQ
jgi:SAM-dependent methyltransferase